jgi:UDP-glucose 4-epimerase
MHFPSYSQVGESVHDPAKYYRNNIANTLNLLALARLCAGAQSAAYNLGNGSGFSVKEVIDAAEHVTGTRIARVFAERRAGDPARLVAEAKLARAQLGWSPRFDSLDTIVRHAWAWERRMAGCE